MAKSTKAEAVRRMNAAMLEQQTTQAERDFLAIIDLLRLQMDRRTGRQKAALQARMDTFVRENYTKYLEACSGSALFQKLWNALRDSNES